MPFFRHFFTFDSAVSLANGPAIMKWPPQLEGPRAKKGHLLTPLRKVKNSTLFLFAFLRAVQQMVPGSSRWSGSPVPASGWKHLTHTRTYTLGYLICMYTHTHTHTRTHTHKDILYAYKRIYVYIIIYIHTKFEVNWTNFKWAVPLARSGKKASSREPCPPLSPTLSVYDGKPCPGIISEHQKYRRELKKIHILQPPISRLLDKMKRFSFFHGVKLLNEMGNVCFVDCAVGSGFLLRVLHCRWVSNPEARWNALLTIHF